MKNMQNEFKDQMEANRKETSQLKDYIVKLETKVEQLNESIRGSSLNDRLEASSINDRSSLEVSDLWALRDSIYFNYNIIGQLWNKTNIV